MSPYVFFKEFDSFRPYIYIFDPFGNDFVYGIRSELTFKLLNLDNEFFPSSFLKAAFPQLNDLGNLVKDHLTIYARVYF